MKDEFQREIKSQYHLAIKHKQIPNPQSIIYTTKFKQNHAKSPKDNYIKLVYNNKENQFLQNAEVIAKQRMWSKFEIQIKQVFKIQPTNQEI